MSDLSGFGERGLKKQNSCSFDQMKKWPYKILYTLCTIYLLSVYVCTFDARQQVVFINKLFEFEFIRRVACLKEDN